MVRTPQPLQLCIARRRGSRQVVVSIGAASGWTRTQQRYLPGYGLGGPALLIVFVNDLPNCIGLFGSVCRLFPD